MAAESHVEDRDDEELLAEREAAAERERAQELEDLRAILAMPKGEGIRFFRRMMALGGIFRTTFTGDSQSFFLEGRRVFATTYLKDALEAAPELLARLLTPEKPPEPPAEAEGA